jgi:hypothetical protein
MAVKARVVRYETLSVLEYAAPLYTSGTPGMPSTGELPLRSRR